MSRIVLGFSGGVDSAVSAMLLKNAGHEVIGLYMDNTDENALRDAVETAEFAGIELEVADVRAALEENVCRPFTDCYLRGETPNPCVICNPSVKFKTLLAAADRRGAELVATGHYARAENGAIYKGRPSNDQTYMLCRLTREQAARAVFPLGELKEMKVTYAVAERGHDYYCRNLVRCICRRNIRGSRKGYGRKSRACHARKRRTLSRAYDGLQKSARQSKDRRHRTPQTQP